MKNQMDKIMKKLDLEFPGITDESIIHLIKQKEHKKEKYRNFIESKLPIIMIMLIFPPLFFFIACLINIYLFKEQIDTIFTIKTIIASVCFPLPPAIALWNSL